MAIESNETIVGIFEEFINFEKGVMSTPTSSSFTLQRYAANGQLFMK